MLRLMIDAWKILGNKKKLMQLFSKNDAFEDSKCATFILVVHESLRLTAPELGLSARSSRTAVGRRKVAIGALHNRFFANSF